MPPPSAGGVLLAEVLGSFSRDEIARTGLRSGLGVHLVSEVMRGALADRACCVGDPDVLPIDTARLWMRERLAARKAKISPEKTNPIKRFLPEEKGTHALVISDAEGMSCRSRDRELAVRRGHRRGRERRSLERRARRFYRLEGVE